MYYPDDAAGFFVQHKSHYLKAPKNKSLKVKIILQNLFQQVTQVRKPLGRLKN